MFIDYTNKWTKSHKVETHLLHNTDLNRINIHITTQYEEQNTLKTLYINLLLNFT